MSLLAHLGRVWRCVGLASSFSRGTQRASRKMDGARPSVGPASAWQKAEAFVEPMAEVRHEFSVTFVALDSALRDPPGAHREVLCLGGDWP